jgi:general secretion pathway protein M
MSEQLKAWWANLSDREQQLSLLSLVFLMLAVVYWGIWAPISNQLQESETQLRNAQQTLTWVQNKATVLVQAGVSQQKATAQQLTLTQIVNSSARQYGVEFSRVMNKNQEIEVWISDIEFDQLLRWLTALENQYSVSVSRADFVKLDQVGHIKVNRLLLGK